MLFNPPNESSGAKIKRIFWHLIFAWLVVVCCSAAWNLLRLRSTLEDEASIEASSSFETDLLFRHWANSHGGVYLPPTEKSPPNPYLSHIPDRDVTTTSGKALTLINPAYMLRQIFDMAKDKRIPRAHITSLQPLRPENAPDPWEAESLKAFEKGVQETKTVSEIEGKPVLRLMRPMITVEGCLKCHSNQGYKVGDIRGGISVSVLLTPYLQAMRSTEKAIIMGHVLLALLGLGGLIYGGKRLFQLNKEREQAQALHLLSEQEFRELYEQAPLPYQTLSEEGLINHVNRAWCTLTGYSVEEASGLNFIHFAARTEDCEAMARIPALTKGSNLQGLEFKLKRKDGVVLEIQLDANSSAKRPRHIHCLLRDVTERRHTQERIREQAALLDIVQDAIIVLDLERRVTFWNKGAETIYGWKAAQVQGRSIDTILYKEVPANYLECWERGALSGTWMGESVQVTKDQKDIIVLVRLSTVKNAENKPVSYLLLNRDITELKTMENQVLRTQRLESLGAMASGAAHDLNNVFSPIILSLDILKTLITRKQDQNLVKMLEGSARRGSEIVQQLLLFGRGSDTPREEVMMTQMLEGLVKMIKDSFPKHIEITARISHTLHKVLGDKAELGQVVANLCLNAREAMPHRGKLLIIAENAKVDELLAQEYHEAKPGHYVMIQVLDTGVGISKAGLEKIFEPYFTSKPAGQGSGLGLPSALGIVRSHGGFIIAQSVEGSGSDFRVYLPAVLTNAADGSAETARISLEGKGERILLVEDENVVREVLATSLRSHGYEVVTASDGAEGLSVYAREATKIDLVITDLVMPVMNGSQTIRALRRITPGLPIIAISGLSDQRSEVERIPGPPIPFLLKPFIVDRILALLRESLDKR